MTKTLAQHAGCGGSLAVTGTEIYCEQCHVKITDPSSEVVHPALPKPRAPYALPHWDDRI